MTENARGGCQKQGLLVSARASSTNVSKPENQKTKKQQKRPKKQKKTKNKNKKTNWGLVYGHISHSSEHFCFLVSLVFLVFDSKEIGKD